MGSCRPGKSPTSENHQELTLGSLQKVFWTLLGAKVSQECFAPPKTSLALVQPHFAPVQEASCSLAPKHLLQPLLTTLASFPFRAISQVHGSIFPQFYSTHGHRKSGRFCPDCVFPFELHLVIPPQKAQKCCYSFSFSKG